MDTTLTNCIYHGVSDYESEGIQSAPVVVHTLCTKICPAYVVVVAEIRLSVHHGKCYLFLVLSHHLQPI